MSYSAAYARELGAEVARLRAELAETIEAGAQAFGMERRENERLRAENAEMWAIMQHGQCSAVIAERDAMRPVIDAARAVRYGPDDPNVSRHDLIEELIFAVRALDGALGTTITSSDASITRAEVERLRAENEKLRGHLALTHNIAADYGSVVAAARAWARVIWNNEPQTGTRELTAILDAVRALGEGDNSGR